MLYGVYIFAMSSIVQENDNLDRLLDGLSLLDEHDQERIIRVVDTLDFTDKKVKKEILNDKIGNIKKESKAR
jgi:hypothetical protein